MRAIVLMALLGISNSDALNVDKHQVADHAKSHGEATKKTAEHGKAHAAAAKKSSDHEKSHKKADNKKTEKSGEQSMAHAHAKSAEQEMEDMFRED
jgi:hypothetical protein